VFLVCSDIGILLTRLPFGSSPAPAHFSIGSDITCDLANDLTRCTLWDPSTLQSPLQSAMPPTVRLPMPSDTPSGAAIHSAVHLPQWITSGTEGYIDDLATATLANDTNQDQVDRAQAAVLMALHLQFRPHAGYAEPIRRPETASTRKLLGEGGMAETIIFLGWQINTRSLQISLPEEKAKAWSSSMENIIKSNKPITYQTLATLVGRINHIAFIIPQARHFINRIRQDEAKARKHRSTRISTETKKDLKLWLKLIEYANDGISLNSIVFREPTSISISDACETGMGGYDPMTGKMWRHKFSPEEQVAFTLNTKEFLAAEISQRLALLDDESPFPCHLNIGDSVVAEAWLYKSNHDPSYAPVQNEIARTMAANLITRKACNYSQHLHGHLNQVADSLSRDTHLSTSQLTNLFHQTNPILLPTKFQIHHHSDQITSWVASLVQLTPKKRELRWAHTPSTLAAGTSGSHSSPESQQTTLTSSTSRNNNEIQSSVCSWIQSNMANTQNDRSVPSKAQLRTRPQTMWLRSSNLVVGQTHEPHQVANNVSNTNDKLATTKQTMAPHTTKKQYP
jgi:hypothetical protein